MTATFDYFNALFPSHLPFPPSLFVEDLGIECTAAAIEKHSGKLYTSTLTAGGVAFVFGFQEDIAKDAWQECRVPVTAALYKGRDMIVCWAFNCLQSEADVGPLAVALGMTGLEEQVPAPGTDGWELIHVDHDASTILAEMNAAYVTNDDPEGGKPVEADATDEPEVEDAPELVEETMQVAEPIGNPLDIVIETYGDAKVLAPYNENDYLQPIIITVANRTDSKNWKPETMPVGKFIATLSPPGPHPLRLSLHSDGFMAPLPRPPGYVPICTK
jgi:hypothetical protein